MYYVFAVVLSLLSTGVLSQAAVPIENQGRTLQAPSDPPVFRGTDWYGNDITKYQVTSAQACWDKCKEHQEPNQSMKCVAYIYRPDHSGDCYPKHTVGPPSPCDGCEGFNTEEDLSLLNDPNVYYGKDRPGSDIKQITDVDQPTKCLQKCKDHNQDPIQTVECKAWLWRRDYHHCYLKHDPLNPKTDEPACVLGEMP